MRLRKFTPKNFFATVLRLAVGTNNDGYHSALINAWADCEAPEGQAPAKSSLSEMREKISHKFFEDIFRADLHKFERKTFRGYHVYAVDGDQLDLPASEDIIRHGFRGYPTSKGRETHYPKMYTTQTLDVISNEVREFSYSTSQDEVHLARALVRGYEKNSITLYDRLYCGHGTFMAHYEAGNYFIVRARTISGTSTNAGVKAEVRDLLQSNKRSCHFVWRPQPGQIRKNPSVPVRLVKVRHLKTKKDDIYVTNLPSNEFTAKEIGALYQRRWSIETSFKDLTATLRLEMRHSKKLNGILQEIYTLLWFVNSVRRQMAATIKICADDILNKDYRKANFKLVATFALRNINLLYRRSIEFFKVLEAVILRSIERRKRNSRSYPRVVKCRGADYPWNNLVKRRPLTERH